MLEWATTHARVSLVVFLAAACSACFYVGHIYGVVFFAVPLVAIFYVSAFHPDSDLAIQEDAREQERLRKAEHLAEALEGEGLQARTESAWVECVGLSPLSFVYSSCAYGSIGKGLTNACEDLLPLFGAVRYSVERLKTEGGEHAYSIVFYFTDGLEELNKWAVAYQDIENITPSYKRLPVGFFEDGSIAYVSLDNRNALVGGLPRSGKSVFLDIVLLGLIRCSNERVLVFSPKILDFQAFKGRAELYQNPEEILNALLGLNDEVEKRKALCERFGKKKIDRFTDKLPHISIIVDEYAVIKSWKIPSEDGKKERKIGEEIERELTKIVAQAAFAGVQVVITSQRLSSSVISTDLRDLIAGNLVSFANGSKTSDQMIFGDYAEEAPASHIPIAYKGVGYLHLEGDMDKPRLFKCAFADEETERRIVNGDMERKKANEQKILFLRTREEDPRETPADSGGVVPGLDL